MIAPAELAQRMDDIKAGRIAVLYVGPEQLFRQARIPGARLLPETGTDEGYGALVRAIESTPKDTEIVVYCGCCPYRSCQNVRPASKALKASGRTDAKYLDLPTNFKTDWTKKGYPVERG
jgi:rhodanese-related sulfurtransferase